MPLRRADSCDYPDFAAAAARAVADGRCERGIVLCTTGIGVSISANKIDGIRCALLSDSWTAKMTRLHNDTNMMAMGNKIDGIRCALLSDSWTAKMTRLHNDTNMMAMGAGVVGENLALEIVDTWLNTEFSGEARHQRRIDKLMALEK